MWINPEIIQPHHRAIVYLITNLDNGEKYIGKKNLFTRRYNKTTGRYEINPAAWESYQSSSTIASTWTNVRKEILYACSSTKEATYIEASLLYKLDALDPRTPYVNKNISGRHFQYYEH